MSEEEERDGGAQARRRRVLDQLACTYGALWPTVPDSTLLSGALGFPSSPMSHALLLRLFLSPSFFSVHVALQYLRIYVDNIGITYYLTRRLRELDTQELREVWGFVW